MLLFKHFIIHWKPFTFCISGLSGNSTFNWNVDRKLKLPGLIHNCTDCYNWNLVFAQSRLFLIVKPVTRIEHLLPWRCRTPADIFVVELQIFCRGQIGLKFVGTSACRALADFFSRLTTFRLGAESSKSRWRLFGENGNLLCLPWLSAMETSQEEDKNNMS